MQRKQLSSPSGKAAAFIICLALAAALSGGAYTQEGAEAVLKGLLDGNALFVAGKTAAKDTGKTRRAEIAKGQHPSVTVLTCSDSRVPPELIFNQGLGEIFVVRVAGNVLDDVAMGSIEYGVEHLHTPLLIILGHTHCGAVKATLEAEAAPEGNIGELIKKILPAAEAARKMGGKEEYVFERAIKMNVANVKQELLKESPVVHELVLQGKLSIVTAIYRLDSGDVTVLEK